MKKKIVFSKLLAGVLSAAMAAGSVPGQAFAAEMTDPAAYVADDTDGAESENEAGEITDSDGAEAEKEENTESEGQESSGKEGGEAGAEGENGTGMSGTDADETAGEDAEAGASDNENTSEDAENGTETEDPEENTDQASEKEPAKGDAETAADPAEGTGEDVSGAAEAVNTEETETVIPEEPISEEAVSEEAEAKPGTPYQADGTYDVSVPHVIVNQIYGGGEDGSASHSFIELYNQSEEEVDLSGWQLLYRSSESGNDGEAWQTLELTGTIDGEGYYLVRCRATETASPVNQVPEGHQEWNIAIHNKGVSVALFSGETELTDEFSGNVTDGSCPDGYVDLLAVQGNDEKKSQIPPAYEEAYVAEQSKKKAVRRTDFQDTDDNSADIEIIDYSKTVDADKGPHGIGDSGEEEPKTTYYNDSFEKDAALILSRTGQVSIGEPNADGGVAEIVAFNKDENCLYVVNGQDGILEVLDLGTDGSLTKKRTIEARNLIEGFTYGDMTSVAVDTVNNRIAVALQAENYAENGRVALLDYNGVLLESYETGVQPDMVTFAKAGRYILTADEGEPREGYGEESVDPEGSVTIVDTLTGEVTRAGFEKFDSVDLAAKGILISKVDGNLLSAAQDLEPEYIAADSEGTKAYVALQEANAIAVLDLEKKEFTDIKSLGFIDLGQEENAADLADDGTYAPDTYEDVYSVPMPDGISIYEADGTTYLLTANEGDSREWGDFTNESKATLTSSGGTEASKVRVLNHEVTAGLEEGKNYLFGGRSFSIYNADTMELVYNSGNDFEQKTAEYLPDWFNCSNDDIAVDSRSMKKGPEPETVTVGRIGDRYYAFIALERTGGIMVYDITDPAGASYVNYINTRDFSEDIAGDVAPEGLAFVPSYSSGSGLPVLVTACEVSGTVAAYTMSGPAAEIETPEVKDPEPETLPEFSSPILITEVVPNTKNLGGSDAWEYYEITNVSSRDVDLDDYDIVYVNPGKTRTVWKPADTEAHVIPARSSMLIWVKNSGNTDQTKEAFRAYYGLPEDSLIAEVSCDGMSNSGSRSMEILTKTGRLLSTVTYNAKDSDGGKLDEDEAVIFRYEGAKVIAVYDQNPDPLNVASGDMKGLYTLPAVVEEPAVEVSQSADQIGADEELTVTVVSSNLNQDGIVNGWIQTADGTRYSLTYDENGVLFGAIPGSSVQDQKSFTYTVTIFDGVNTAQSAVQTVNVAAGETVEGAPALVLTEILPDSSNINGADAYEFVEIYNNSNLDIDLKDYKLYYTYPDDNSDVIWWETSESKILKSGETLVFWIKNGANDSLTREDFNKKFGTSLTEDELIEISCGGMANGSLRGLKICSNVKDDIDVILYNENGADDTTADRSITYQNQYTDGAFATRMTSNNASPTPGTVTDDERPVYAASLTAPEKKPVAEDLTPGTFSNSSESLTFDLQASSEETTVKTVKLYLKYNGETEYTGYNLLRSDTDHFRKTLSQIDLLNKKSYTYYFEVSDGFQAITTEVKTVENTDQSEDALFNLEDGETISGSRQIIVNGETLSIDGEDKSKEAARSLNGPGKIAFEASQTDVFFKNAVAVGDEIIGIFNEGTYDQWATYVYDIGAELFDPETGTVTVEFHAGNKANVLEHNIENNDDFVLKNIRMVLPGGTTLYPESYQAKMGLGEVEHPNLDDQPMKDVTIDSQEKEIQMGDGTSKYEILYVTFRVPEKEFSAVRYLWNTKDGSAEDGIHTISNGSESIQVYVDNTAPVISANIEEGRQYHSATIEVSAEDAHDGTDVRTTVLLDGKNIETPYSFRALEMEAGEHTLYISSSDRMGNKAEKTVHFVTPKESADIDENVSPENGSVMKGDPTLSVKASDSTEDEMTVTFKKGQRYTLSDESVITRETGVSTTSGTAEPSGFTEDSGDGFPYEIFTIAVGENSDPASEIDVKWSGNSNNEKTFLYVYNAGTDSWDKLETVQTVDGENMTLQGSVKLEAYLTGGEVKVLVQNGEGYTPPQYEADAEVTPTNENHTPREEYAFTFAVESDPQYYNEDYDGNPDQTEDGVYQYQLDIHNLVLNNRESMNIQYMFNDGDLIDDEPNEREWEQADAAYALLDEADFPYGVLAGNHDVGHLSGDYTSFSKYFGESRYSRNPWYGGSYKDNRGHYDLITVDGIDFIMLYMGWGIGDEEIEWMNQVLAQYSERRAILNFHEYLLASGGMGEEPQKVYDEVVAKNENVCLVLSGHYHNACTRVDEFTNADGSVRKVYSMLFDYQGLPEGGLGYMRFLHFDTEDQKIIVRTYSPSLNDYDAVESPGEKNAGNEYVVPNANLYGEEEFEISFADLGITRKNKKLETTGLDVNVYGNEVIGQVTGVTNDTEAAYIWKDAPEGLNGWYAEVTDENGGLSRTGVQYLTVIRDVTAPELTVPGDTAIGLGDPFDPMEGVSALDDTDGDMTGKVLVTGTVDTGKAGTYELIYEVTDSAGNKTQVKRLITVQEESEPIPAEPTDPGNGSGGSGSSGDGNQTDGDENGGKEDGSNGSGGNGSHTGGKGNSGKGGGSHRGSSSSSGQTLSASDLNQVNAAQTGDTANPVFWGAIGILSAGAAILLVRKRRRTKSE